jgi:hypothetical protein
MSFSVTKDEVRGAIASVDSPSKYLLLSISELEATVDPSERKAFLKHLKNLRQECDRMMESCPGLKADVESMVELLKLI